MLMKRFYKLFSLLLLAIVGASGAFAQDYKNGDLIETTADLLGKDVVLYAPGLSGDHPAGYMDFATGAAQAIGDDNIFQFEKVDGTVTEGDQTYDLYILKQKSTGKYVSDYDETKYINGDPEQSIELTADKSKAFKMTALPFQQDNAEAYRSYATAGVNESALKQDLSTVGFVFARDKNFSSKMGADYANKTLYLGGLSKPFYSPYTDTNIWNVYALAKTTGVEKLQGYMEKYFPQGADIYQGGTEPGAYKADAVAAAKAAYKAATDANASTGSYTEEQIDKICADLKAAYEGLANGRIPLSAGYYFIKGQNGRYLTSNTVAKKSDATVTRDFVWSSSTYTPKEGEALTTAAVGYIWKVTPTEKADSFLVQNILTEKYMNGGFEKNANAEYGVSTDNGLAFTLGEAAGVKLTPEGTADQSTPTWIIATYLTTGAGKQFHSKFNNNAVMNWDNVATENNCYHFVSVSADEATGLVETARQELINNKLQDIYNAASAAYNGAMKYTGASADEKFDAQNRYVTDAKQFFSENKETREGSFAGLLDGDYTTYFHSNWSSAFTPSADNFHYLGVDLGKAAEGVIVAKMAKRVNTKNAEVLDFPKVIAFYGSNDAVADSTGVTTAGTWTFLGSNDVAWNIAMHTATPKDSTYATGIGTTGIDAKGYRYIKFGVMDTDQKRGYFALSEFNVFPGTATTTGSKLEQVSKATLDALTAQLASAKAQLAAKKATNEQIAALKKAYDAFMLELPEPSRYTDAISAANTFANGITEDMLQDGKIGYYPTAALQTLKTTLAELAKWSGEGKSAAEINEAIAKVEAAVAAFKATLQLPEAGKYYTFRLLSTKPYSTTDGGVEGYRAQLYSAGSALKDAIKFTNANHLSDADAEDYQTNVQDTVQASAYYRYLWYVEKAEAGKLVLRNVGTGMYIAPHDGQVLQSATPAEMSIILAKGGVFAVEAGTDADGVAQYLNAKVNTNKNDMRIVTWKKYADDENGWFTFEEVNKSELTEHTAYWPVAWGGKWQVLTLPFGISAAYDGTTYDIVGVTEDNKLVLTDAGGEIPAGKPFVFRTEEDATSNDSHFGMAEFEYAVTGGSDLTEEGASFEYAGVPVAANGLVGTLTEAVTPGAGFGYFNNGNIASTDATTQIGTNAGYIHVAADAPHVVPAEGDVTIDLGDVVISSIDNASVVVLPKTVNVYGINGALLRSNVKSADAAKGLPAGLYIIGGQKVLVK